MNHKLVSSSGDTLSESLPRMMLQVIIALVPGTIAYAWHFGPGVLINIALAIVFAVMFEAAILKLRNRPAMPQLTDLSAIVSGWLFALCLPMHSPWWLVLVGIAFTMTAGKHLYGGLGFNPFNPAMVGYVVLLISFPQEMTTWHLPLSLHQQPPGLIESIHYTLVLSDTHIWDTMTSATPLDQLKTAVGQDIPITEVQQAPLFGQWAGEGWEWVALWWLVGGLWLLFTRTIRWHIPVALILAVLLSSLSFHLIDPETYASPRFHLLSGAVIIGAFFIATDPVTAATTDLGRLIYACLIGLLIYVIRNWAGYPDGVAFAVLLANMCVPIIDYYTRPRVYGQS